MVSKDRNRRCDEVTVKSIPDVYLDNNDAFK